MQLTADDVNALVAEAFPMTTGMGFSCVELGDGVAVARLAFDESNVRPGGIVPGPSVFGLADIALWYAVFSKIGFEPMAVTSDLTIHFLRPAIGSSLLARCRLTKLGRRLAHGEVRVWEEGGDPDRLIAFASGAYAIPDRSGTDLTDDVPSPERRE
jgi:uncharacterized protein (TIGR00369 family)